MENKRLLLDNLRQYAALTYPELEQYLTEHGLTEREIDFCNLYLLGLRGKEIGRYLGLARHYTVSSGIRRKLGLGERDVNIDAYLRQIIDMLRQTPSFSTGVRLLIWGVISVPDNFAEPFKLLTYETLIDFYYLFYRGQLRHTTFRLCR